MANVISFSVFELFTFLSFFFSISSLIILSYILIRRRNIINAAKKRSIRKSQIKSSQNEVKLNESLQNKEKEIKELKQLLQKYMEFENSFFKEIKDSKFTSESDYSSLIEKLKSKIEEINSSKNSKSIKGSNENVEVNKLAFDNILRNKHPLLTEQEIGLCNYFRQNTPSKEIAILEGITDGTVRVYKNKIKNKIGLSQLDSLDEYLVNLQL